MLKAMLKMSFDYTRAQRLERVDQVIFDVKN